MVNISKARCSVFLCRLQWKNVFS